MPGVWEVLTADEIRSRMQVSTIETVASGNMTIVSGAETGVVRYIMRVRATPETETNKPIFYVNRVDASGTATVLAMHRFAGGLSGEADNPDYIWQNPDPKIPVADLHAMEYLAVRASISGMVNVSVDHLEYGGPRESRGSVEDLR